MFGLHFCGMLISAFETSGISASVSWSCSNFLPTLLDFPLSIMAISISVANQPAGKSQCSLWDERIPRFVLSLICVRSRYVVQAVLRFLEFVS